MNEHEMTDLLERAGSGLDPDVERLVAGGVARGRTARRRRRGAGVALAVVAVVAAGTVTAPVLLGGDSDVAPSVAAPSVGGETGTPPEPGPALGGAGLLVVPAREVPGVFADALPGLTVGPAREPDHRTSLVDRPREKVVFFDVDGMQTVFSIRPSAHYPRCQVLALQTPELDCGIVDGIEIGTLPPTVQDGVTFASVVARVHGFEVSVGSYNAVDGKEVPPLAAVPPISVEQMRSLVLSDVWFADDAPDEPPAVPVEIPVLTPADQLPVVISSVFPGDVVVDQASGGYQDVGLDQQVAHVRLDGTRVTVTTSLDLDGVAPLRRCRRGPWECRTTADGAVVSRYTYQDSTGVVVYRDGYSVTVEAPDPGPALSEDDLEQVALADGWLVSP